MSLLSFLGVFPSIFTTFLSLSVFFSLSHSRHLSFRSFSISFPNFLYSERMKMIHKMLKDKPRENSGTEERIRKYTVTTDPEEQDISVLTVLSS